MVVIFYTAVQWPTQCGGRTEEAVIEGDYKDFVTLV